MTISYCTSSSATIYSKAGPASPQEPTIDRSLYLTYLRTLKLVHGECGISLRNARRLDLNSEDYVNKQLSKPALSMQQFMDKIRKYAANFLFGAEAAQRMKEEELQWSVDKILNEWGNQYSAFFQNFKIAPYGTYSEAYQLFHHILPKCAENIRIKNDYDQARAWQPNLSDALISSAVQRIEKVGKTGKCIFHLVSGKKEVEEAQQPDLSSNLLSNNKPSRFFDILCHSYDSPGHYSFNKGRQKHIKNEDIANLLAHEKNLDTLDLTNCTSLTDHCLSAGHEKIKKLIIRHTFLEATKIDIAKFPSLQKITCSARRKGFISLLDAPPSVNDPVYRMVFNKDKKIELSIENQAQELKGSVIDIHILKSLTSSGTEQEKQTGASSS